MDRERHIKVRAVRFEAGSAEEVEFPVIREVPLTLFYNGLEIITLLTTPDHHRELAVGFLRSEGFLEGREDLISAQVDEEKGSAAVEGRAEADLVRKLMEKRTITSGCGKGSTFYHALDALQVRTLPENGFSIPRARLIELAGEINRAAMRLRVAGGVHHAALAGAEGVAVIREDIGRHNAIDKIQGHCFLEGLNTADKFLLSTGRITSEVLIKAAKMGVPMLVTLSKPSSLALELAERLRLSLVGDLRGRRGYIFKDFGRIT